MTPEERLTKIERTLQSLTDAQVEHSAQIEKQNAGIRDLIVVGRTCLDSITFFSGAGRADSRHRPVRRFPATCRSWITSASAAGGWCWNQASRLRRYLRPRQAFESSWMEESLPKVSVGPRTADGRSVTGNSIGRRPELRAVSAISAQRALRSWNSS